MSMMSRAVLRRHLLTTANKSGVGSAAISSSPRPSSLLIPSLNNDNYNYNYNYNYSSMMLNTNSNTSSSAQQQCFSFSTKTSNKANNKKNNNKKQDAYETYEQEKAAAKAYRAERYQRAMERKQTTDSQRRGQKSENHPNKRYKGYYKQQFRKFYDPYADKQLYLDRQAKREQKDWKIRVGVLLERLPVVLPDEEEWEVEMDLLQQEKARYGKVWPKEFGVPDPMELEPMTRQQMMEFLPEGYTPAPRETQADKTGNVQTIDRKLKTRVYLTVRPDDATGWAVPNVDLNNNETLKDAAKRAIQELVGEEFRILCLSNCPMGVDLIPYDDGEKKDTNLFGEKTFYMRVQYEDGSGQEVKKLSKMNDWGWLAREEMVERVEEEKGEEKGKFYHYLL